MARGGKRSTSFKPGQSGNPGGRPTKPATIEARKIITDVKALAKEVSADAIDALTGVMSDPKAPPVARVSAATALLDRGWGKPTQTIEANVSILDKMSDVEQSALLAALDALAGDSDGAEEGTSGTTH